MSGPVPRLSLCLIARDEEKIISRCLSSAQPIVDEIILVDTGSSDSTPDIARSFGAKVVQFSWSGDFSAARNVGLSQATGDWILILDADMEVPAASRERIRSLLANSDAEAFSFRVQSFLGESPGIDCLLDVYYLLFRNRPEYRFRGAIHEQVLPAILANKPDARIIATDTVILHYGFLDGPLKDKNKNRRNLEILERELSRSPSDPFLRYARGVEYLHQEDIGRAKDDFLAARERLDQPNPLLAETLKLLTLCDLSLGLYHDSVRWATEGIRLFPAFTDLHYLRATARRILGDGAGALEDFRQCLELGEAPPEFSTWAGAGGFRAHLGLGLAYEDLGEHDRAVAAYLDAVSLNPGCTEAIDRLIRLGRASAACSAIRRSLGQGAWGEGSFLAAARLMRRMCRTARDTCGA